MVTPIYVRKGLAWEDAEHAALIAFVKALGNPNVKPVTTLSVPVRQIYGRHWSVTGQNVPSYDAPDGAVYLPGRNVLLLGLTAVWCSIHGVSRISIGTLGGNPFSDATPAFFESFASVLSQGLGHRILVEAPFRGGSKSQLNPALTPTCRWSSASRASRLRTASTAATATSAANAARPLSRQA